MKDKLLLIFSYQGFKRQDYKHYVNSSTVHSIQHTDHSSSYTQRKTNGSWTALIRCFSTLMHKDL